MIGTPKKIELPQMHSAAVPRLTAHESTVYRPALASD